VSRRQICKNQLRPFVRPLAAAVLTAAWLLPVPASQAQTQSPAPGPAEQSTKVPDQKLDAAVAALKQVVSVKDNYRRRIETAAPSDQESIANEANNALVKAVTDQGLSVEEYNSIMVLAQNDPEVHEKVLQRMGSPAK
jgi:hypothetical protein